MVAVPTAPPIAIERRRFTVEEYSRLIDADVIGEDERVELIEGEIVAMSPMKPRHANTILRSTNRLVPLVLPDALVSVQCPIALGGRSLPEPDLAIIRAGLPGDAPPAPADILIAIEVADSSLDYDRMGKFPPLRGGWHPRNLADQPDRRHDRAPHAAARRPLHPDRHPRPHRHPHPARRRSSRLILA